MINLNIIAHSGPGLPGIFPLLLVLFLIITVPLFVISEATKLNFFSYEMFKTGVRLLVLLILLEFLVIVLLHKKPNEGYERARVDIKIISNSLELFKIENSTYPSTEDGLQTLIEKTNSEKYPNWRLLLKRLPDDPWGEEYKYLYPGVRSDYDIYSFGPDKIESEDDIGNWEF